MVVVNDEPDALRRVALLARNGPHWLNESRQMSDPMDYLSDCWHWRRLRKTLSLVPQC